MYQLKSAIVKDSLTTKWKSADLSQLSFKTIYQTYRGVYLTLYSDELKTDIVVNLDSLKSIYHFSALTITDFLVQNGSKTIVGTDTYPTLRYNYVKYADALRAAYTATPIHRTAAVDSSLPDSEKTDVLLRKEGLDYELFFKNCLVSVNGYFHRTDYDSNGIYIRDGNTSRHLSGECYIGIYSFASVAEIECFSITPEMIGEFSTDIPFNNKFLLKLPKPISGYTPLLVIGGYLHALDAQLYRFLNDESLVIDFDKLPFIERYYASRNRIDLSSLSLTKYQRNKSQVDLNEFYSNEVITQYMTLPQSFVVYVKSEELFFEKQHLELTKLYGSAITEQTPDKPLITTYGRVSEYWSIYEDQKYSIRFHDSERPNYLIRTTSEDRLGSAIDALNLTDPVSQTNAYFMLLGNTVVKK